MYKPRFFKVQELVPPAIYEARGEQALALLDDRVLLTLDQLRVQFGVCTVNDWLWGGQYSQRGLRTPEAVEYSPTSQHSFGRAMDCHFAKVEAAEVRQWLLSHGDQCVHITFLEDDISWLHFDVRNGDRLTLWSPVTHQSRRVSV